MAKDAWDTELYEAQHAFVWKYGRDLVDLLDPKEGESILDVGCGTGHLTWEIARRGARVVGLDSSPAMIGQARQNYPESSAPVRFPGTREPMRSPELVFVLADAASMTFREEFDAVFSNAALHWMLDTEAVARRMSQALRAGGRLVLECGGRGNIARIEAAMRAVFADMGQPMPASRTLFRSIAELSGALERAGLEVVSASLFDRPTRLEGPRGMEQWLQQFSAYYFDALPAELRRQALQEVAERLRPTLFHDDAWYADYRRLRVTACKSNENTNTSF